MPGGTTLKLLKESAAHPISSGQDVIDVLKEKIRPKFQNKKIESLPRLKVTPEESQVLQAISKARARSFRSIQKKSKLTDFRLCAKSKCTKKKQKKHDFLVEFWLHNKS